MTTSEEYLEQLASEWKQTAESYRADLTVARTELSKLGAAADAALARADAAEWEVRTFEAALERAESEAAALHAEVERLRAENIELESFRSVFGRDDAKKIAAANALLVECSSRQLLLPTALLNRIVAHLSGQAPARTDHISLKSDARHLAAANALLRRVPRWTVPADTVKPDRFQQAGLDLTRDIDAHLSGQAPARTDHERAVLAKK
jgi:hypothetical protein